MLRKKKQKHSPKKALSAARAKILTNEFILGMYGLIPEVYPKEWLDQRERYFYKQRS